MIASSIKRITYIIGVINRILHRIGATYIIHTHTTVLDTPGGTFLGAGVKIVVLFFYQRHAHPTHLLRPTRPRPQYG